MKEEIIIQKSKECLLRKDKELGYNSKDIEFIKWIIKEAQKEIVEELVPVEHYHSHKKGFLLEWIKQKKKELEKEV